MIKKTYSTNIDAIVIDCGGSIIHYKNGYGGGDFKVYLLETEREFYDITKNINLTLNSDAVFENAKVCSGKDTLFELNGWCFIYHDNYGNIYIRA